MSIEVKNLTKTFLKVFGVPRTFMKKGCWWDQGAKPLASPLAVTTS